MRRSALSASALLVRHQHQGGALFAIQRQQQFQHDAAGGSVEVAGGFVGQENGRTQREGARQRHALLLAAGELHGVVIAAPASPTRSSSSRARSPPAGFGPASSIGKQHVFFRRQRGDQVIGLEDESDLAPAQQRHVVFAQTGDVFAVQDYLAAGGRVEPGQQAQQRTFAAAGRPHDGGKLAARDAQIDAFEDFHTVSAGVNGLG